MKKSKKFRKLLKADKIKNRHLVHKYPWLKPWRRWRRNREQYGWPPHEKYSYITWHGIPRGWEIAFGDMILKDLGDAVNKYHLRDFHIIDMKEKWGMLCLDVSGYNDVINDIIDKYEVLSQNICIFCGKPDVGIVDDGWVEPMCFDCYRTHWHGYCDNELEVREHYIKSIGGDNANTTMSNEVVRRDCHNHLVTKQDITETANKIRYIWNSKYQHKGD